MTPGLGQLPGQGAAVSRSFHSRGSRTSRPGGPGDPETPNKIFAVGDQLLLQVLDSSRLPAVGVPSGAGSRLTARPQDGRHPGLEVSVSVPRRALADFREGSGWRAGGGEGPHPGRTTASSERGGLQRDRTRFEGIPKTHEWRRWPDDLRGVRMQGLSVSRYLFPPRGTRFHETRLPTGGRGGPHPTQKRCCVGGSAPTCSVQSRCSAVGGSGFHHGPQEDCSHLTQVPGFTYTVLGSG